jgi:hypothetical protein
MIYILIYLLLSDKMSYMEHQGRASKDIENPVHEGKVSLANFGNN